MRRVSLGAFLASVVAASTVYGPSALTTQADAGTPPTAVTFSYTGAAQSWTVPAGVTSVQVDLRGAQGQSVFGGLGGETIATIPVTPGQNLGVYVGGTGASGIGGWNGGGGSSFAIAYAAGGGGASDIRIGGTGLTNRVVVAGGGGGALNLDPPTDVGGIDGAG